MIKQNALVKKRKRKMRRIFKAGHHGDGGKDAVLRDSVRSAMNRMFWSLGAV